MMKHSIYKQQETFSRERTASAAVLSPELESELNIHVCDSVVSKQDVDTKCVNIATRRTSTEFDIALCSSRCHICEAVNGTVVEQSSRQKREEEKRLSNDNKARGHFRQGLGRINVDLLSTLSLGNKWHMQRHSLASMVYCLFLLLSCSTQTTHSKGKQISRLLYTDDAF